MRAKIILEDETTLEGSSFGAVLDAAGEVVFSTAMTGYIEAFTDPSYKGQILVMTYPLIGNYGVTNGQYFQSEKIQISGLIVTENCVNPSHFQNVKSLRKWLVENNIPAVEGIDTRALTQKLRYKGTMLGKIQVNKKNISFYDPNKDNLVAKVSVEKTRTYQNKKGAKKVCLIDCGYKKAILSNLLSRGLETVVIPWNYNPLGQFDFAGVVVSNGPGDPKMVVETIKIVRQVINKKVPVLGICLGNQIVTLAAGGETYKLKFGHHSLNQPVQDLRTKRCFITSQNHGFAVEIKSLPKNFKQWFVNLNDQTCEGVISDNRLVMGVQFHPEGCPGPTDTEWVFDEFVNKL